MRKNVARMMAAAVFCALAMLPAHDAAAMKKVAKTMEYSDFIKQMQGSNGFTITIDGTRHTSYFTEKNYIHFETIIFFGREDIKSTHRILYHTEDDLIIAHNDIQVTVRYGQIRTYLSPSVEKKYTKKELASAVNEREKRMFSILEEENRDAILLVEYGLEPGTTYYARLKTESYHLPPEERGGRPKRRENTVVVISDKPFPNTIEITPLYKGWRY